MYDLVYVRFTLRDLLPLVPSYILLTSYIFPSYFFLHCYLSQVIEEGAGFIEYKGRGDIQVMWIFEVEGRGFLDFLHFDGQRHRVCLAHLNHKPQQAFRLIFGREGDIDRFTVFAIALGEVRGLDQRLRIKQRIEVRQFLLHRLGKGQFLGISIIDIHRFAVVRHLHAEEGADELLSLHRDGAGNIKRLRRLFGYRHHKIGLKHFLADGGKEGI